MPTAGLSEAGELDVAQIESIPYSQLQELWRAVSEQEDAFRLDNYTSLPDLVSMSIGQLRQLQCTLLELSGDTDLTRRMRSASVGGNLQGWCINERHFKCLPNARWGQECSICCQIIVDDAAVALPCSNLGCASHFHVRCIRPWLERRPDCPLCRANANDLVLQKDCPPDCHQRAPVARQAATNAQLLARLCQIQTAQISCLSAPSAPGSTIVGLFNSNGPSVISTGDWLTWLRSQDFERGASIADTNGERENTDRLSPVVRLRPVPTKQSSYATSTCASSSQGNQMRWKRPSSASSASARPSTLGFRTGGVGPLDSRHNSRKPQTLVGLMAGMQLRQRLPLHGDSHSQSDPSLSQSNPLNWKAQHKAMSEMLFFKRKAQRSPANSSVVRRDNRSP